MSFKIHDPEKLIVSILSEVATQTPNGNILYKNNIKLSGSNTYTLNLDPWDIELCSEFTVFAKVTGDANEMYAVNILINGNSIGLQVFGILPSTVTKTYDWATSVSNCAPTSTVQIQISSIMLNNFDVEIGDLRVTTKKYTVNPHTEMKSLTIV